MRVSTLSYALKLRRPLSSNGIALSTLQQLRLGSRAIVGQQSCYLPSLLKWSLLLMTDYYEKLDSESFRKLPVGRLCCRSLESGTPRKQSVGRDCNKGIRSDQPWQECAWKQTAVKHSLRLGLANACFGANYCGVVWHMGSSEAVYRRWGVVGSGSSCLYGCRDRCMPRRETASAEPRGAVGPHQEKPRSIGAACMMCAKLEPFDSRMASRTLR